MNNKNLKIKPFKNCPALDGCHCVTNSLAKIFYHHQYPLSEDMLLGLGAGMGFIYWQMKMGSDSIIFVGGRGNGKLFFNDLGRRTGVKIKTISTSNSKKAGQELVEKLNKKEPVMLFGDMGFLPWFEFPQEYHFGGHTFVVCGYDGINTVLISDMDPKEPGSKKGFYFPVTLDQLSKARNSTFKPFPPKNTRIEFDFSKFHNPTAKDITDSIKQTIDVHLNPPIKNIGIKGMRYTANMILTWPKIYKDKELKMNLFNLYIFIEIGGTGGGCFRYMYSRFLKEAAKITKNKELLNASTMFFESGKLFTEIGTMFKNPDKMNNIEEKIKIASEKFNKIADIEEKSFTYLESII